MNLKHLFYFWKVGKLGSVIRAAEAINVTPQTLSGQIGLLEESLGTPLFARKGRSLILTEAGKMAMEYAEEMFALSAELELVIKHNPKGRPTEFKVGVSDAVPKTLAFQLLQPAKSATEGVRLVCREWKIDRLLTELSVHRLDLVISDKPIPASISVRAYNHRLLESGITFLVHNDVTPPSPLSFPACLSSMQLLLLGEDSALRNALDGWFEKKRIRPQIVGEFDDSALMTAFGRGGMGVFPVPTIVEEEFTLSGEFSVIGRTTEAKVTYYAISVERKLKHPCVLAITESAQRFSAGASEA
ncbi:transcriptional activator NhaR [Propionivibrio limicola]|uniref:transcriptional activator NhaR n=1 Tax=Propionivibrio limicola TaxID=167645 RepID=UPI001291EC6A|nr:transcriptional activator NhaR [Propionivibrio limicola]